MANLLHPLTPLGHAAPEITCAGPVTITENTGVALASLATRRGREADVAAAAQAADIPQPGPGQAAQAALYGAIWLGDQQWMIAVSYTHLDVYKRQTPPLAWPPIRARPATLWALP